ncbi:MAG TPA: hypothetical protein VFW33_19815 [Gemmataceae bacterium]|nr:hypothetical protein [Gemmataceae bacterium]
MTAVEDGLKPNGVKKVVPDAETLEAAFRRAASNLILAGQLTRLGEQARAQAERIELPHSLEREINDRLKADPTLPWDKAVAAVAARVVRTEDAGEGD